MAVREYRDSDALISELGDFFLQGFDDAIRQIKKAFPDLDLSNIKVKDQGQTSVMPAASEDTDDLFADDEVLGDGESTQAQNAQVQPVEEATHQSVASEAPHLDNVVGQTVDTQVQQLSKSNNFFFFFSFFSFFFFFLMYLENNFRPLWMICKHSPLRA